MLSFHFHLSATQNERLRLKLIAAESQGELAQVKRITALLALAAGYWADEVAEILQISLDTLRHTVKSYLTQGISALVAKRSPGRPTKLSKHQRQQLAGWIEAGPEAQGFSGGCWRTPMIQHLIFEKFGLVYNVHYLSELLNNMGFSFQKATFVHAQQNEERRQEWLATCWPKIMAEAQQKDAHLFFGDEISFPQWGTLNYTWAKRGQQPIIKTSGSRKNYKVFGLIDYFTGEFLAKGHEGKLNAESYQAFLEEVLRCTRKHIILIQDNARYHVSASLQAFFEYHRDRITVYQLPPYSPGYNPIEQLWKKLKQWGTHLIYFPTFKDLKFKVNEMLLLFKNNKEEILSLFGFYNELNMQKNF